MKYNSIGEQLIAKAQELDPNYKPDKFNDMSEALDVILNNGGSGGQAMFDIVPYVNESTMTMTEEGYNLLYDGLRSGKYAGIVFGYWNAYPVCIDDVYSLRFQYIYFEPDSPNDVYKLLTIDKNTLKISGLPWDEESQNLYIYSSFYIKPYFEGGTSSLPYYNAETNEQQNLTIGDGLAIENGVLKATGGDSSKVWYELSSLFFLENITQEQFDAINNLALQNQLAGINCAGLYCPLTFYNDGRNIDFFYPWYENDIFTSYIIRLNADLSVNKIPYSTITLPQNTPTSQLIPSITTSNHQQNLTIGNGLEIKNGALQATGGGNGGEILELNEADSNTVQFITPGEETTLTGAYDLNKIYKGFKITTSDMEQTFYFDAMMVVPGMNFKAYIALLFEISGNEIIYSSYEIGITNNATISIIYKNERLPLTGGGSDITITFED